MPQDVAELGLERGERVHQRGGIELPRNAERELVGRIIRKMRLVDFRVEHRAAPLAGVPMEHRAAAVKVGLLSR